MSLYKHEGEEPAPIHMVGALLEARGWARSRPKNQLGRFRTVYTRRSRSLALIPWQGSVLAIYERKEVVGWLRQVMGSYDTLAEWIDKEAS